MKYFEAYEKRNDNVTFVDYYGGNLPIDFCTFSKKTIINSCLYKFGAECKGAIVHLQYSAVLTLSGIATECTVALWDADFYLK